jgi:hypothetical protein
VCHWVGHLGTHVACHGYEYNYSTTSAAGNALTACGTDLYDKIFTDEVLQIIGTSFSRHVINPNFEPSNAAHYQCMRLLLAPYAIMTRPSDNEIVQEFQRKLVAHALPIVSNTLETQATNPHIMMAMIQLLGSFVNVCMSHHAPCTTQRVVRHCC